MVHVHETGVLSIMNRSVFAAACAVSLSLGAMSSGAFAQIPGMGGQTQGTSPGTAGGLLGGNGAGGMLGGAMGNMGLPSVSSASSGNVAGILSYCVSNNAVSSSAGNTALSQLTGKGNVASSSGYQNGSQGLLETGSGNTFSLSNLSQSLKQRVCKAILSRAQNLL